VAKSEDLDEVTCQRLGFGADSPSSRLSAAFSLARSVSWSMGDLRLGHDDRRRASVEGCDGYETAHAISFASASPACHLAAHRS